MTGRPALAGLDAIEWPALSHAYGSAEDTPDLLRRLAALDEDSSDDDSEEILGDLWASICHQGSVYPATVAAVPFLAEIAAAEVETAQVLYLLGSIAEAADPREVGDADPVRAAVAACFDLLAPLLESPDADVREALIFVLAHGGPVERVRPLLLEAWQSEADPDIRIEVLHALIHVDPAHAAELAEDVLSGTEDDPALLVSAAFAWIHAGRALNERVLTAALMPITEEEPDFSRWYVDGILFTLVLEISDQHGASAAGDFLARALIEAQDEPKDVAELRLDAARNLILGYRGVAEPLIEPITGFLDDPALRGSALNLLGTIGPAAFTEGMREELVTLSEGSDDLADEALATLIEIGDPHAPTLLARHLTDRPRALDAASGSMNRLEPGHVDVPFDADLLAAIRRRLTELADAAGQPAPADENIFMSARRGNEPIQLSRILGAWGEAAIPAAPELARILPIRAIPVARALTAIVGSSQASVPVVEEVLAALRALVGEGDTNARIAVAETIRALSGDSGPLLEVVLGALHGDSDSLSDAALAAADLPEHAESLVPRLTEALLASPAPDQSLPAHGDRIQLVSTLHRLSGDIEHAIPALRESLSLVSELFTSWTVAEAADTAAALGADAVVLLPELTSALDDHIACPAAAEALLAIDPKGPWENVDIEALGNHLINTLILGSAPRAHLRALDVLETLAPELPTTVLDALHDLVEHDQRILSALPDSQLVRADENARDRIRALLTR